MRWFLCSLVALLLLGGAAQAANSPNPVLNAAATYVAGHQETVWCETDWSSWLGMAGSNGVVADAGGFTRVGTPVIYVAPDICTELRALVAHKDVGTFFASDAILTLAHEAVHQRGVVDESQTDCTALGLVQQLATTFFNVPKTVRQKYVGVAYKRIAGKRVKVPVMKTRAVRNPELAGLQADAEAWHKAKPAQYQGDC